MTFEQIHSTEYHNHKVEWYKSSKTGLELAIVNVPGPLVHLNIAVRTEVLPDAYDTPHYGMPHTLEHLIFLGSEDYQYKGFLDKLANRCFAQGTNAYTAVDQTVYTVSCAGSEGFFRLLPVYMDHVLHPTITDAGFTTEVHHINGNGEDAGVVYCEMEGTENNASSLAYHTQMENLFAGSSYASNTGGRVEDLRKLDVDKVRNFHKKYYRPDNICVVISGDVNAKDAFASLASVENKLIKKGMVTGKMPPLERPFTRPVPKFEASKSEVVRFPANDEEGGAIVYIGWRLCPWDDFMKRTAMYVLWKYLNESSISPIKKTFVEIEEPYAGRVSAYINSFKECNHSIVFSNVNTDKCDEILPKFFELVKSILEKGIDMERMARVIRKRIISELSSMEASSSDFFSDCILEHFLYGPSPDKSFDDGIDDIKRYKMLQDKDASFWADLMKEMILDRPYCSTICKPSIKKGESISKKEEERVKQQKETLGEEELNRLKEVVHNAQKENEKPIPEDKLVKHFPIPKVENIPRLPVVGVRTDNREQEPGLTATTAKSEYSRQHLYDHLFTKNDDKTILPCMLQFNHFSSAFVNIRCWMDTSEISDHMRPYVELYLEVIFGSPIRKGDKMIKHEDVIRMLSEDCVSYGNTCGAAGGNFSAGEFAQLLSMEMKFEKEKYELMVQWMKDLLFNTVFTKNRLKIAASRLINDTSRVRRSPTMVASSALKLINFDEKRSNHNASNMVKQLAFLEDVIKRLDDNPALVIEEMDRFRRHIVDPKKLRIHVYGNIMSVDNPLNVWKHSFLPKSGEYKPSPVADSHQLHRELLTSAALKEGNKKTVAFGMRSTDSGFLHQSCVGLRDPLSADRAPLLVLIEILTCLEGPLWVNIRGKGLAYGYGIRSNISQGLLSFFLYRSGGIVKAYRETCKIVDEFRTRKRAISQENLEGARSCVIYDLLRSEETGEIAALSSFFLTLRGTPQDTLRKLLISVEQTDFEDVHRVLEKYLWRLFDPKFSNTAIVTNPSKLEAIQEGFKETRQVKVEDIEEFLNGSSSKRTKKRAPPKEHE